MFCSELPASINFSDNHVAASGKVLQSSTVSLGLRVSVTKPPKSRNVSESATAYDTVTSSPCSKSLLATSSMPSGLFSSFDLSSSFSLFIFIFISFCFFSLYAGFQNAEGSTCVWLHISIKGATKAPDGGIFPLFSPAYAISASISTALERAMDIAHCQSFFVQFP